MARSWVPPETTIVVIGAGSSVGATTLAVALATASRSPARVIECCSASTSGLASASTAELGTTEEGWRRGTREGLHHRILLERTAHPHPTAAAVPLPTAPDQPVALTLLDGGWSLDHHLGDGWLAEAVTTTPSIVVAANATIPGLRRLEATLAALHASRGGTTLIDGIPAPAVIVRAAVLGPRRKKWDRSVEGSLGPATRALDALDGLVQIPLDRRIGICGLTSAPLPPSLLSAAGQLLDTFTISSDTDGHGPLPAEPARRA